MKKPASPPLTPVARIFLAVLLIATLEGAVRKWSWPGATIPLLLLRDTLVAWAIVYGLRHRSFSDISWVLPALVLWSALVTAWLLVQLLAGLSTPAVAAIGFRSWLPYLWFAALCGRVLSAGDVDRIQWYAVYMVVPMAALAMLQHFLPIDHLLNRQADGDGTGNIFVVADGIVRVTGTFSFSAGYVAFLAFVTPSVLAIFAGELGAARRPKARALVCVSFLIGVVVSGSRGTIIGTGIMCAALFLGMLALRRRLAKSLVILVGSVMFAAVFTSVFFDRALEATQERFERASEAESLSERIGGSSGTAAAWEQIDTMGKGIGMGNNAAGPFMGGIKEFLTGEGETDKMLGEAGFLGAVFTFLKWLFGIVRAWSAFARIRQSDSLLPWLMWMSVGILLLTGNLTSQLTAHAYGWLAIGLALAVTRTPRAEHANLLRSLPSATRANALPARGN